MTSSKRNGNIELLRFVFAVCILMLHLHRKESLFSFQSGYLGVEFFYMITGIFMGRGLCERKNETSRESMKETFDASRCFILKKIISVYPYFFFSCLIGLAIHAIRGIPPFASISDLLFLQNLGFPTHSYTGTVWFLSAMFIALFFLYPIARKKYDIYVKYFAPFVVLYVTGFLLKKYGNMCQCVSGEYISVGVMRAFSAMSFGLMINEIANRLQEKDRKQGTRIALTVCELLGYTAVFLYMALADRTAADAGMFFLLGFCLCITVSGQSFFNGLLDQKPVYVLGKFSMPLFMNHYYWVVHFKYYLLTQVYLSDGAVLSLTIGLSVLTSILVYILGSAVSKWLQSKRCVQKILSAEL